MPMYYILETCLEKAATKTKRNYHFKLESYVYLNGSLALEGITGTVSTNLDAVCKTSF